jgi:hypothetical protein
MTSAVTCVCVRARAPLESLIAHACRVEVRAGVCD